MPKTRLFNGKLYTYVRDFAQHSAAEHAAGNGYLTYSRIVPCKGGWELYQRKKTLKEFAQHRMRR